MPPESIQLDNKTDEFDLSLEPIDNSRLANLSGQFDENIHYLEDQLKIEIHHRGHQFHLLGDSDGLAQAKRSLLSLYKLAAERQIAKEDVHLALREMHAESGPTLIENNVAAGEEINTRYGKVKARGGKTSTTIFTRSSSSMGILALGLRAQEKPIWRWPAR